MRRAFGDTLVRMAAEDERIVFLTGDLGFQVFGEFEERFPDRFINTGIAEAQLIDAAAGLALEGFRPVAYSIAPFITARPYEQIRFGIAYHNLPVLLVGAGGGYTYAKAGVTHHAPDDLMLMSALPGFTVAAPGGPDEMSVLMEELLRQPGPGYLRVGKFGEPDVGGDAPVVLGKGRKLFPGEKLAIVTVGDVVSDLRPAVEKLRTQGFPAALYHFHTVKPLDMELLGEIAAFDTVAVLEESVPEGGVYAGLCRFLGANGLRISRLLRFGAPEDDFITGNPSRGELRARLGITPGTLEQLCMETFRK